MKDDYILGCPENDSNLGLLQISMVNLQNDPIIDCSEPNKSVKNIS